MQSFFTDGIVEKKRKVQYVELIRNEVTVDDQRERGNQI